MKHKLLKSVLTICLGVFFSNLTFAQGQEIKLDEPNYQHVGDFETPYDHTKGKAYYENWKRPIEAASSLGGSFTRFVSFLFPDSTVLWVPDGNDPYFFNWHSVGAAFDPSDLIYEVDDDGIRLTRFDKYSVDSLYLPYIYVRYIDSVDLGAGNVEVVDTLILQFFKKEDLRLGTFGSAGEIYAKPNGYDPTLNAYANSFYEVKIPLKAEDATDPPESDGWRTAGRIFEVPNIAVDDNPNFNGSNVFAWSMVYKTMVPYEYGDTLEARDGSTPTKRLNYFGHSMYQNTGSEVPQEEYYNNSFWTNSELRYGMDYLGWENNVPGNAYFDDRYVYYQLFITTNTLGAIGESDNEIKFGVKPNPVSRSEKLMMDFHLLNAQDVTIEMFDLLGHKVKDIANGYYSSGEHQMDVDITDLNPGVYFYTVKAGHAMSSKKVTITN